MHQPRDRQSYLGDITRGAAWVSASRLFIRALGFISTLILARLLVPEDFGLIAIATTIAGGLELLGAFNFDIWLIRHRDPDDEHYNSVWTLGLLRNITVALLILLMAVPASVFFEDARIVAVLMTLAVGTGIEGLKNVGIVDFQRNMTFEREFHLLAVAKLGSFIVTVLMACFLRSYWALLAGILTGRLLRVALSYRLHPYRPSISLQHVREIFGFSKWLLSVSVFGYLYAQAHAPLISKIFGGHTMGLYAVSQEVADMASSELLAPLRRVLLPAYSKMAQDAAELRRSFTETFAIILMLGLPIVVGLWLVVEQLVPLMLGARWLEAIPLIEILCLYGAASICIANQGPVLITLGKNRFLSHTYALGFALQVSGVLLVAPWHGLTGVAWVIALVHWVVFLVSMPVTMSYLRLSVEDLIHPVWRVLAACAAMAVVVGLLQSWLVNVATGLILLASVVTGVVTYPAILLLLWWFSGFPKGPEQALLNYALSRYRNG